MFRAPYSLVEFDFQGSRDPYELIDLLGLWSLVLLTQLFDAVTDAAC